MSDRGSEEAAWDGEGTDPWLTARLEALTDAEQAERTVWQAIWDALKAWLATVRAALREDLDPVVIKTHTTAWTEAVTVIATTTIYEIAEDAYRNITGDAAYPVDMAAAARERALTRRNQLADVPDRVYSLVQRQIADAVTAGTPGPELAAMIDETLDATATPRWENRATVIARTEAIGALNAGRADGHQQIAGRQGGAWEKMWIATLDDQTRPTHRAADRQRVPVGGLFSVGTAMLRQPGDPAGPPDETIQCRCTTVLVRPGQNIDFSRRFARRQE